MGSSCVLGKGESRRRLDGESYFIDGEGRLGVLRLMGGGVNFMVLFSVAIGFYFGR